MKRTVAIILAGGTGKRMGEKVPKQFLEVGGRPLITYSVRKFDENKHITDIIVVSHKDHLGRLCEIIDKESLSTECKAVPGGEIRQESSYLGVKSCPPDAEIVLIHDASRPFVEDAIIDSVILEAERKGSAGPVIEMEDTVVIEEGGLIESIPERSKLRRIQTPQGFKYDVILKAHEEALEKGVTDSTDDCSLVIGMGEEVAVVAGSRNNIKVTSPSDLRIAEEFLKGLSNE